MNNIYKRTYERNVKLEEILNTLLEKLNKEDE